MGVQTLPAQASTEEILAVMEQDGALVIKNLISPDLVKQMVDEVMPFIDKTPKGRDDFTGRQTQRTGALVARTPTCRRLILCPALRCTSRSKLKATRLTPVVGTSSVSPPSATYNFDVVQTNAPDASRPIGIRQRAVPVVRSIA